MLGFMLVDKETQECQIINTGIPSVELVCRNEEEKIETYRELGF